MRSVVAVLVATFMAVALSGVPAQGASKPEQGDSCKKVGKVVSTKVGKGKKSKTQDLVCVSSVSGKVWWPTPEAKPSPKKARKTVRAWQQLARESTFADLEVLDATTAQSIQADLAQSVALRDEWAAKAHEANTRLATLRAESAALPSRIQAAAAANESAKEAHEEAVAIAERELATLNSMYPEYSSALDAQYGGFGPGLRCSFGELEYCAEAAAYDALRPWASSVISRYNVQAAVADAAVANMGAHYQEWENRYATWQELSNRNNAVAGEIEQAERDSAHAANMLNQTTAEANRVNERVSLLPELQQMYTEFRKQQQEFNSTLAQPKVKKLSPVNKVERLDLDGISLQASSRQLLDLWSAYVN